ncbi:hypothetical protein [Plantibacter sp. YIM 135249]|uniref:hypothetical protein n=1 Tax=Plantibacter sp. YIM 135249 TaxID=3423918 RepID=UPI003D357DEA
MTEVPVHMNTTPDHRYGWVRRLLPRIVIGALIAAAVVGVYAVLIGEFNELCWRLIGTIALFVFFSLVSWYDADVSARRAPWFGAVSVVTSVFLLIIGLVKIWVPGHPSGFDPWWSPVSWFLLVGVVRIGLLHVHLVLNTQRRFTGPVMNTVTGCTLALVGLLTLGLAIPLIFVRADVGDVYWRLLGVIAILDVLGTILIPLTYSLFGPKARRVAAPSAYGAAPGYEAASGYGAASGHGAAPGYAPGQPVPQNAGWQTQQQQPQPGAAWPPAQVSPFVQASPPLQAPPIPQAAGTGFSRPAPVAQPRSAQSPALPLAVPLSAYPRLDPSIGLQLEWPRYVNGTPLPARPDGTPDFTGVVGYTEPGRPG